MNIRAVKTEKIVAGSIQLTEFLDKYLKDVTETSIVAITSKVLGIMEGRVVPIGSVDKEELIRQEADYYLPAEIGNYGYHFTITHKTLVSASGIDESNSSGNYALWPKNPQETANKIRHHLVKRLGLKKVGVIVIDSACVPLRYGTLGTVIGHSGFLAVNDYRGQLDLFGRPFKVSQSNIASGLAVTATMIMGEGTEQTPIAIIEEVPFVEFQEHDPTIDELNNFYLEHMEDDLFAPFLQNVGWLPGQRGKS